MAPRTVADARLLVLHGEETFLVEEEARRVLDGWRADLVSDFGFEAVDPAGLNAARLRDIVRQLPFLDPYRVVAIRSVPTRRAEGLAGGLADVPETTRILITVSGRLGAGNALAKAASAHLSGQVREFARLKPRGFNEWASNRARELRLPGSAAGMVVQSASISDCTRTCGLPLSRSLSMRNRMRSKFSCVARSRRSVGKRFQRVLCIS